MPYIDGCSSISQAGRSGDTILYYRVLVFPYAVVLMLFWLYSKKWLEYIHGHATKSAQSIFWLGMVGSIGLLVYIDFLGTAGEYNRLLRRVGAALYFVLIPVAQSLLLYQHYKILRTKPDVPVKPAVLRYQFVVISLMWMLAVASVFLALAGLKTSEMENVVEWNYSLMVNLYSAGMILLWKDFKLGFRNIN